MACMAYIAASEDPKGGNCKKKNLLTAQILQEYLQYLRLRQEKISNNSGTSFQSRTGYAFMQRIRKQGQNFSSWKEY